MKIKEGFVLRTICGEQVVSGEGAAHVNFSKLIRLNESAAYLFKAVQDKEFTVDSLSELLLGRYEVAPERARSDAEKLASLWAETGIAE